MIGPAEDNMIVTDLYPGLLTDHKKNNMIVTDLYPRLLTGHHEEQIIVTHPPDSMIGNVLHLAIIFDEL